MIAQLDHETDAGLGQTKALTHGLEVLRILAESGEPLTSTEIARRIGLHQSSASRILRTLIAAGYVRKPDYHSFAVDVGVLTLGGTAIAHFPLANRPRKAMAQIAEQSGGLMVSLATLWRGEVIYFLRHHHGHDPVVLSAGSYPLHLSSPALRLMLELPEDEARRLLAASRERHGWERPTPSVPTAPGPLLRKVRGMLGHDSLLLRDWQGAGRLSAAIPLDLPGQPASALALSGPGEKHPDERVLLLLQEGRRTIEQSMQPNANTNT